MLYIITWTISLLLYLFCPKDFNLCFNISLCAIYSLAYIKLLVSNKNNYINFSTVFLGVNICIIFFFPLCYPYIDDSLLPFITFQEQYLNKGTALCTMLAISYMLGQLLYRNKKNECYIIEWYKDKPELRRLLYLFCAVVFVYYIPKLGMSYASVANVKLESILTLVLCFFTVYLSNLCWNKRNSIIDTHSFIAVIKKPGIILISLFILYVALGIRSSALQLLLIPFALYTVYVKNINYKKILVIGFGGLIGFSVVSFTRATFEYDLKEVYSVGAGLPINTLLVLFNDFITNTKNIYLGLEYVDTYDYLYGQSFVLAPFSFAPYLPTIFAQILFNKTPAEMSTQWILTNFAEQKYLGDIDSLIGTQCFIDVYMNVGVVLSVMVFVLVGYFVKYIQSNSTNNLYLLSIYVTLFSYSVFMGRGSIGDPIRLIIWVMLIVYLFTIRKKVVSTNE